ncbi:IS3 family transposase [Phaeobacter gallaeciensis]|uniref:IS3 family transposase n=1 Tax=Phaeobacter gallaeciensis TaxID=60890 RepID=UPI002380988A|nr:IS3 family transposase [Phaeobacter gallaeciensis]MDE4275924.1 IS3 family transposase [Phaeobacter gallaeciensis]MDE4301152.1 IS3 family transposase [Phaeobacter gallaeciensis]MDE5187154.1 IS3 family transposase [Phaeobacter gallaeciensis]
MPKKRFNDEQIAFALRQAEAGTTVGEICRKLGIAEATFYRWKKVYAGMGVSEIRRLKQLEDENGKLKRLVADLTLDKTMLQNALGKKVVKPVRRREVVRHYQHVFEVSERRACRAMGLGRASHRYQSRRDPEVELRMRFKELAEARVRYGYRRLHILLQREGWHVNHKRLYRLYCEEDLSIRTRSPKRRRACRYRSGRSDADGMNHVWAMDFMSDWLFDERPFRILTIVDCFTREALATAARTKLRAYQVIDELDRLARVRGKPRSIRVDNGPEFAGRLLDQWAYLNKVELDFSRPGKPTDNAHIQAFNSHLRQECLNASWFLSMDDARTWRTDYNETRLNSSLGNLTPSEFASQLKETRKVA